VCELPSQLKEFNLPQVLLMPLYSTVNESVLGTSVTIWFGSATNSDVGRRFGLL